eukprot:scaffold191797_cov24-Prasinocladus_malaysianus.AAC.1
MQTIMPLLCGRYARLGEVDSICIIAVGHAGTFQTDTIRELSEALARYRPLAGAASRQRARADADIEERPKLGRRALGHDWALL